MLRLELTYDGDAVRAHDDVNRAFRQRLAEPVRTECDFADGRVLDEHRDDDVAAHRELGDGRRRARACRRKRRRLRRKLIEYPEIVPRVEQTAGHSLSHAAEADESDFHDRPYVEAALRGRDFDARARALQGAVPLAGAPRSESTKDVRVR